MRVDAQGRDIVQFAGERRVVPSPRTYLDAMAEALRAGGNSDTTTMAYPSLNHLFQTCVTGSINE